MKFSEKLIKLRKQNKMSQEQLADMLDVSRQSVSKWESGTTYPEMDKLLTMCKIFKCSLDELTNDEITDIDFEDKRKGNIIFDILDMIIKTFEMFRCMNFKQTVGCLGSMFILSIILLFFKLPVDYIINLGNSIIRFLDPFQNIIQGIWYFLMNLAYIVICATILIYVFKKRYLDNFNYSVNEKIVSKNIDDDKVIVESKPEIIIKSEKSNGFFKFVTSMALILIKAIFFMMLIPFIFTFFFLFASLIISIILLFKGVLYLGVILGIIFCIILNYVILEIGYNFLFNRKMMIKRIFVMIIVSLAGAGISLGIFFYEASITKFIDEAPVTLQKSLVEEYNMSDNLYFLGNYVFYGEDIHYEINEEMKDKVKVKIEYNDKYRKPDLTLYEAGGIGIYPFEKTINNYNIELLNFVIKDLKNKEIHNYSKLFDFKIIVISSAQNIEKIKNNTKQKILEREKAEEERNKQEERERYEQQLSEYEMENEELKQQIYTLEREKEELEIELENYKQKVKEYKENLNNLLDE